MRTTIELDDPLFRAVKTRAVREGITLKKLIANYIEAGLRETSRPTWSAVEPRTRSQIPIAWKADGTMTPSLTNGEIDRLFDEEDYGNARAGSHA